MSLKHTESSGLIPVDSGSFLRHRNFGQVDKGELRGVTGVVAGRFGGSGVKVRSRTRGIRCRFIEQQIAKWFVDSKQSRTCALCWLSGSVQRFGVLAEIHRPISGKISGVLH